MSIVPKQGQVRRVAFVLIEPLSRFAFAGTFPALSVFWFSVLLSSESPVSSTSSRGCEETKREPDQSFLSRRVLQLSGWSAPSMV